MLSISKKAFGTTLFPFANKYNSFRFLHKHNFDYDLLVIGGGSGGLATAQEAAKITLSNGAPTKKIGVLDFVRPSSAGTTWGLGGTCVNVGCIPKKLMHQAAILGESIKESKHYGWEIEQETVKHSWTNMVTEIQNHVKSLNWGYRVSLRSKHVEYINALAKFKDAHTIEAVAKNNKVKTLTAENILIAVGGRPRQLNIPGSEYCITSDDIFSLSHPPGKTLIIGASYVALECAGFLTGFGFDTTVMARSIFLRGFDQQMAGIITSHMEEHGTKFIRHATPLKIEKVVETSSSDSSENSSKSSSPLRVYWQDPKTKETVSEVYDTVMVAIGRNAETNNLNLDAAGVIYDKEHDGKIPVTHETTNIPSIHALGDVIKGHWELTPVAIQSGRLLARRLFANSSEQMDYHNVPTAVFTPLEYGACGLSEERAIEHYGEDNIEVYHTYYTPLEWTVPHKGDNKCYCKIIVHKKDNERVVGIHLAGPNAGEILQGFAVAMKAGATKHHFDRTIGIHPTTGEELVGLHITKRSGEEATKTGC